MSTDALDDIVANVTRFRPISEFAEKAGKSFPDKEIDFVRLFMDTIRFAINAHADGAPPDFKTLSKYIKDALEHDFGISEEDTVSGICSRLVDTLLTQHEFSVYRNGAPAKFSFAYMERVYADDDSRSMLYVPTENAVQILAQTTPVADKVETGMLSSGIRIAIIGNDRDSAVELLQSLRRKLLTRLQDIRRLLRDIYTQTRFYGYQVDAREKVEAMRNQAVEEIDEFWKMDKEIEKTRDEGHNPDNWPDFENAYVTLKTTMCDLNLGISKVYKEFLEIINMAPMRRRDPSSDLVELLPRFLKKSRAEIASGLPALLSALIAPKVPVLCAPEDIFLLFPPEKEHEKKAEKAIAPAARRREEPRFPTRAVDKSRSDVASFVREKKKTTLSELLMQAEAENADDMTLFLLVYAAIRADNSPAVPYSRKMTGEEAACRIADFTDISLEVRK